VALDQSRPRVLLADDYHGMLVGLERLLAPSCDVVGRVGDGVTLLDAAARLRPDVIVLDVNIPGVHGLEACRRIKQASPVTQVVFLTAADDDLIRDRAFGVGASAFVPKHRVSTDLLPAILRPR
jgi:DNA-binding NarL/FixJ family response regulator